MNQGNDRSNTQVKSLHIATLNVRGLGGKLEEVLILNIYNINVLFICETWVSPGALPPHDYCILYSPYPQLDRKQYGHNMVLVSSSILNGSHTKTYSKHKHL